MPLSSSAAQSFEWPASPPPDAPSIPQGASLHHLRLTMRDGRRYAAAFGSRLLWLAPAAGCLLQPAVGDTVLASIDGGRGYILTVLERARPDEPAEISVPGSLRLSLPDGRLDITASRGIALDGQAGIEFSAEQWRAAFGQASLSCGTLRLSGQELQSAWETRSAVCSGTRLDVAARNETHYGSSVRRVAGHEESTAQSVRQMVDRDWAVQAGSADIQAQDHASLNADSIQIG